MTAALMSLQNVNKKNEEMISELTKQREDAEHRRDKAKIELEIMEDNARDVKTIMKQREYYIDKQQQIENEMLEQERENNRYKQMKDLEEHKRMMHEKEMEGIRKKTRDR